VSFRCFRMSVTTYLIITAIARILIIWGCISLAHKKRRDRNTAFILGLVFGIWALIGYALVKTNTDIKCPKCKAGTILRAVLGGKDKGKKFYVCVNYPKCIGRIKA